MAELVPQFWIDLVGTGQEVDRGSQDLIVQYVVTEIVVLAAGPRLWQQSATNGLADHDPAAQATGVLLETLVSSIQLTTE